MAEAQRSTHRVLVTDVDMPFFSMVRFMVKWAIAAIPALIILVFLGVLFWTFVAGLFSSIGRSTSGVASSEPAGSTKSEASADPAVAAYLGKVSVKGVKVGKSVLDKQGVWGEIKNEGDRTLKRVQITVYCLGPDGKPVFEKESLPVLVSTYSYSDSNQPLKPGYGRQFGVSLDDVPSDWGKRVEVKVTSVAFE